MAREMGLGVIPWSPLASGVLTGKYQQSDLDEHGSAGAERTRKNVALGNGALSARGLNIDEVVKALVGDMGRSEARPAGKACRSTCRSRWLPYPQINNLTPLINVKPCHQTY